MRKYWKEERERIPGHPNAMVIDIFMVSSSLFTFHMFLPLFPREIMMGCVRSCSVFHITDNSIYCSLAVCQDCLPWLSLSQPAWHPHMSVISGSHTNVIKFLSVSLASHGVKTAGWSFTPWRVLRMVFLQTWAPWHKSFTMRSFGWRGPQPRRNTAALHSEDFTGLTFIFLKVWHDFMDEFNIFQNNHNFFPRNYTWPKGLWSH